MAELSEPTCNKCRWHKVATAAGGYAGRPLALGIMVSANGWPGVDIEGRHYDSLGAVYCEHVRQPRGLVLTNYTCPNFERPPDIEAQRQLEEG